MNGGGASSTGVGRGLSNYSKSAVGKQRDRLVRELKSSLPKHFQAKIKDPGSRGKTVSVSVESKDYRHIVNDALDKKVISPSKINKLSGQLNNSYCRKSSVPYKTRKDKIDKFYYMKVKGRKLYFNIARYKYTRKNGQIYYQYRLHAITKNMR